MMGDKASSSVVFWLAGWHQLSCPCVWHTKPGLYNPLLFILSFCCLYVESKTGCLLRWVGCIYTAINTPVQLSCMGVSSLIIVWMRRAFEKTHEQIFRWTNENTVSSGKSDVLLRQTKSPYTVLKSCHKGKLNVAFSLDYETCDYRGQKCNRPIPLIINTDTHARLCIGPWRVRIIQSKHCTVSSDIILCPHYYEQYTHWITTVLQLFNRV